MATMIDRVARAIYEKRNGHGCKPWSTQSKSHKAPYLDDAKAAIFAMREPTEDMLDMGACCEKQPIYMLKHEGEISRDVWEFMIDAALNEKEST